MEFYYLQILDENGYTILDHVANYSDDSVYCDHNELPQPEWRKSHHLINWVEKNKPNWKIVSKHVPYEVCK